MADLGTLNVGIGADTSGFERGMSDAQQSVEQFSRATQTGTQQANRSLGGTERAAKSLAKAKIALAASAAAVSAALVKMTIDGLAAGDEQVKLARAMGLTNEQFVIMERAADLSGISVGQLETSTRQLNRALVDAEDGSGRAADAFHALGIEASDLRGLDLDEQMVALGEAFEGVTDRAQRASIAQDLFGRSGGRMLNLLEDASGTIGRATDEVRSFGLALTEEQGRAIEAANDDISTIRSAFEGFSRQLAADLAPAITQVTGRIIDFISNLTSARQNLQQFQDQVRDLTGNTGELTKQQVELAAALDDLAFRERLLAQMQGNASARARELAEEARESARVRVDALRNIIAEQERVQQLEKDAANARTAQEREAAALELAAIKRAQDREEALTRMYAQTSEGQEEAIRQQIAFFETFEPQGPKATAILEMLNEQLERFNEISAEAPDIFEGREAIYTRELENIGRFLMSEEELINDSHERRIETVLSAMENMELTTEQAHAKIEALEEQHQERLNDIQKQAQRSRIMQAVSTTSSIASNLTSFYRDAASSTTNDERRLFEIRKRAGIASALINTAQGVTNALATTPGPMRWVEASAVALAGAAQVAAIRSQSFGGDGTTPTPQAPSAAGQAGPMQTITVAGDFSAGQMFTGSTVRALMEEISEASQDGARVVVR